MLLLTYPGYRPAWMQYEQLRNGWPAMRRLSADMQSVFLTAYEQVYWHALVS